nr:oxygenase MpaB family protein [Methylobacterium nodulans]
MVGLADLERSLDHVRAEAAGLHEGAFGPDSALWQVDREAIVFLGAGRALLMQLAHPWVAAAIADHSTALDDPIGRFHRTFGIVFALVFGSLDQALTTARRLHRRHASIRGTMPERVGPYPKGSGYLANEASALMWVHATLVDTALATYELVCPPLGSGMRERYFQESRRLGALFGIPYEAQPPDGPGFGRYMESMLSSDVLTVGEVARVTGARVLSGAGRVPVPHWYRDLTAGLLPDRLRSSFGLPYGRHEQRRAARALEVLRRIHPLLPARIRYVGPYFEASGRLSGTRQPDRITRWLNRLWIGRSSLPS